jgi:hypothetical protein
MWAKSMMGLLCGLAAFAGGCGRSAERFTPPDAVARASLAAALEGWKAGRAPGTIEDVSPQVQVVDTERQPGQTLLDYQVLSEAASTSGRAYVVRLKLNDPTSEERVRFIVVGIDPIWVFRKGDFDRLAHWEHPMHEPADEAENTEANEK